MNRVHRFVTNDFTVRIAAVNATEVVQEMQSIQKGMPLATVGVGRSMVAAILMASTLKEDQQVGLLFKGNGPLVSVFAEASFEGHVRGYCPNPDYQSPQKEDALNLGKAIGNGHLTVARHQPFQRQPFQGMVQLVSGEIGDDVAHYLEQSQQIRSMVSLGVYLDAYGKVLAAGGFLIEVMPGVEDEIVEKIRNNASENKTQVSKNILDGQSPRQLVEPYLQGLLFTELPHEYEVKYFCPCSPERVLRALTVMGEQEVQSMIEVNESAEVGCQICGRKYQVSVKEMEDLRDKLRKNSMH